MKGSDNAFVRLAVAMMGFGLFIGLVFPAAAVLVGVEPGVALSPMFVLFTVSAGLLVGGFNIFLARTLVRPRLNRLVAGMQKVDQAIDRATYTGDWSSCTPEQCSLPSDTNDEFGEAVSAFNHLVERLAATQDVQGRLSSFTERMSANLDVAELCASATEAFRHDLGAAAVAVFGIVQGELALLSSHAVADPEPLGSSDLVLRALRDLDSQTLSFDSGLVIDAAVASVAPSEVSVHPLQVRSAPIGAVVLAFAASTSPATKALAPLLMSTLAVGLSNALTHENTRRLAALDPLTGLFNRRFGLRRLHEEWTRSVRTDQPLGVIVLDIDHFKAVNDTHGRLAGDAVLKNVAREIRSVTREGDVLVRYGGEEFLAILPGAAAGDAFEVAERMRRIVEGGVHSHGGVELRVTISAGVASTSRSAVENEMELVNGADQALYAAKEGGRNRTTQAS